MKIALTTDHAGFEAIKKLQSHLETSGHECVYYGPDSFDAYDDYPDFMFPAAQAVANGECDRAIIMGGSGQGEAIAANRIPGVRAAVFYGPESAKVPVDSEGHKSTDPYEILRLSRQHNDANVLSLSSRFLTFQQMEQALDIWLEEPFSKQTRHSRRIKKLDTYIGLSGARSEDIIAPRLQVAFLIGISLYYLVGIVAVLQTFVAPGTFVTAATWAYQVSIWALPLLYVLLGMSFVWRRYKHTLERLFFGSLLGVVGFVVYSAFLTIMTMLNAQYRWFVQDFQNPNIWNAFGFNWALMMIGVTIFTGILALMHRKRER